MHTNWSNTLELTFRQRKMLIHNAKKPLQLLKGILQGVKESVIIEYNETNAELVLKYRTISRLVEGKYPN